MPFPGSCRLLNRSEEHTSELQSQFHLVCRLLLEKKDCISTFVSTVYSTFPLLMVYSILLMRTVNAASDVSFFLATIYPCLFFLMAGPPPKLPFFPPPALFPD